jgi:hypothetical protein
VWREKKEEETLTQALAAITAVIGLKQLFDNVEGF